MVLSKVFLDGALGPVDRLGALGTCQLPLEVVALELASVLVLAVGFGGSGGASEEVAGDARIAESLE